MAKVSKNARTASSNAKASKDFVKVIKAFKSPKTGAYAYKEAFVHKDNVKQFLQEA